MPCRGELLASLHFHLFHFVAWLDLVWVLRFNREYTSEIVLMLIAPELENKIYEKSVFPFCCSSRHIFHSFASHIARFASHPICEMIQFYFLFHLSFGERMQAHAFSPTASISSNVILFFLFIRQNRTCLTAFMLSTSDWRMNAW